jgi:hypothetical protein
MISDNGTLCRLKSVFHSEVSNGTRTAGEAAPAPKPVAAIPAVKIALVTTAIVNLVAFKFCYRLIGSDLPHLSPTGYRGCAKVR